MNASLFLTLLYISPTDANAVVSFTYLRLRQSINRLLNQLINKKKVKIYHYLYIIALRPEQKKVYYNILVLKKFTIFLERHTCKNWREIRCWYVKTESNGRSETGRDHGRRIAVKSSWRQDLNRRSGYQESLLRQREDGLEIVGKQIRTKRDCHKKRLSRDTKERSLNVVEKACLGVFIHSFICSFIQYFSSTYYVPDTILGAINTVVNQTILCSYIIYTIVWGDKNYFSGRDQYYKNDKVAFHQDKGKAFGVAWIENSTWTRWSWRELKEMREDRNHTKASGKKEILWQMKFQEQSPKCGFRSGLTGVATHLIKLEQNEQGGEGGRIKK